MAIQNIDLGTVIENGEDGDVARTAFTKVNENFDDLDTRVTYIESLDIGTVTSVNDILPVDGNVDLTPADIGAATAAQGAKADTAVQADVFATALNQKVDKVEGYQLSQEDYTTEEKNKLASLESSLFLGVYGSLAELEAAHPTSDRPGEYAFIPAGGNIYMFVWDADTERWVTIGSGSEAITAEQVKTLYESNPNTNAFTDAEKTKLSGIQAGAQVNVATNISQGTRTDTTVDINSSTGTGATLFGASTTEAGIMTATDKVKLNNIQAGATANQTDSYLLDRANHTGTQPISSVTNLQTSLDSKQATLVSGTNIKTINGASILGSGNLVINAGGIVVATAQASTSGTAIDFVSIPSTVNRITVILNAVSTTGTSPLIVQLGTNSGIDSTGYAGTVSAIIGSASASVALSSGFNLETALFAVGVYSGSIVFTRVSGNIWIGSGMIGRQDSNRNSLVAGSKTLGAVLDRVRLTTVNGTDSFDAGSVNIFYEV